MEKKLFYVIYNGDESCTAELSGFLAYDTLAEDWQIIE